MTLKKKIEYCLEKYPETRNDDACLTYFLWYVFHKDQLLQDKNAFLDSAGNLFIKAQMIKYLPREDTIKRFRAKIQNEEFRFTPTTKAVIERREANRKHWKKELSQDHYNFYA